MIPYRKNGGQLDEVSNDFKINYASNKIKLDLAVIQLVLSHV